ncbi:MAG TPA: lamin tail domain-containing protein [Pyrinomonadaceae bacterium]|nr:lamin tail domain-containing protein [Pyrinomonadaceae bacterium]
MNRTVRLGVATTLVVVCLSLLDVSVFAQKKRKPRRKRAKVARILLPSVLASQQANIPANVIPQTSASANNIQSGLRPTAGSDSRVTKSALAASQTKAPGSKIIAPTLSGLPAPTLVQAGEVIISELRLRGPAGAEDEFIELYNNTDSDIIVESLDGTGGWTVALSDGTITGPIFTIPNGALIPARGHRLGGNSNGYSLCNYPGGDGSAVFSTAKGPEPAALAAPCVPNGVSGTFAHTIPNHTWDFDVPDGAGVALFATTNGLNFTAATRLDAVGFTNSPALYKEGNGILNVVTANLEHTYYRDLSSVTPRDTADNASDFLLVGTTPGLQVTRLGAPGPENLQSPIVNNTTIAGTLYNPSVPASSSPNRDRIPTPEPNADFGTMLIRRTITNNTGLPISRLRFRVINITSFGTPGCSAPSCAELRALTSADEPVGGPVVVLGLRLEEPPEQAGGGANNSSLSADVITILNPILPGESRNVVFKLGVMRTGSFKFFVNIEALNGSGIT